MAELLMIGLGLAIGFGLLIVIVVYAISPRRVKTPSRLTPRSGNDPSPMAPSTYDPTPGHDGFSS